MCVTVFALLCCYRKAIFMWYVQFDVSWISRVFIYEWPFTLMFVCCCCCNSVTFYDWRQCVRSIPGNYKIFLVQLYWHLAVKLYRIVMRCIGMWGLSLAMIGMWGLSSATISSVHNSAHPPEWAATRRLLRIYLHFWRVGDVMQGAYHG